MSANNGFKIKTVVCESHEVQFKTKELEAEWITSVLRRIGVPKIILNKVKNQDDDFGSRSWRNYLFDTKRIIITRLVKEKETEIIQINTDTGKRIKVGRWTDPEVSRVKKGKGIKCELNLKYWQII